MQPDKRLHQATQASQMVDLRSLTSYLESFKKEIKKEIFEAEHPVGSIYMADSEDDSPDKRWGWGTWARIEGKFIVGASDTDTDFDVNDTGGAKTVTTSNHTHGSGSLVALINAFNSGGRLYVDYRAKTTGAYTENQRHYSGGGGGGGSHSETSGDATEIKGATDSGGSESLNKLPPYLAKYMWQRTG